MRPNKINTFFSTTALALKSSARRAWQLLKPTPAALTGAAAGVLAVSLLFVLAGLIYGSTAPGWVQVIRLAAMLVTMVVLPVLGGLLIAKLVDLLKRLPYAFHWQVSAGILMLLSLAGALTQQGRIVLVVLVLVVGSLLGAGVWSLARSRSSLNRAQRGLAYAWTALGAAALVFALAWYALPGWPSGTAPNAARMGGSPVETVRLPDPSQPGPYQVQTLTYGSGTDRFRPEYGSQSDWISQPVDGSQLLNGSLGTTSVRLRRMLWGFDFDSLPVNGRVWMPAGAEGPFPLVLMVHGNHSSTEFSDPGFGYLGELLASRGFIFVSVDQNFLNGGFPDLFDKITHENDARGWLLLEHLRQLESWNQDTGSPFFGRIDMDRIAVGGHSRGGEAAAVAAAFNRLPAYPENGTLDFNYNFNIRAVAAIAPIDGQYLPGDRGASLEDVYYFVIHGSHDADVLSFDGINQYERVSFTGGDYFKSALYVYRANHGQFNTIWGDSDSQGFVRGLINRGSLLSAAEQEQVAKVYLTAFFEAALLGRDGYRPVFQDARAAAEGWLPDTIYISRYDTAGDRMVATYEEDVNLATLSSGIGTASAKNLDRWTEKRIPTRWGPGESAVVILGWNEEKPAEYALNLALGGWQLTAENALIFAIGSGGSKQVVDLTVVLEDSLGRQAGIPLSERMLLQPQLVVLPWKTSLFFKKADSEPVLQSYSFPLAEFEAHNPSINLSDLQVVRFVFDKTESGSVILDDIGFR